MELAPREDEKMKIYVMANVARRRRDKGLELNVTEATALISEFILEGAREGRSVSDLMEAGRHVVSRDEVMEDVPDRLDMVQVEATFPDGTKLVTCHDPVAGAEEED